MKTGARLEKPREKTKSPQGQPARAALPPATIPGFSPRSEDAVARFVRAIPPERLTLGAGLVSLLIYIGFILAFPITKWWNHPHVDSDAQLINDMGRITGYSPVAAIAFVLAVLALFACQFLALIAVAQVGQTESTASPRDRRVHYIVFLAPLIFAAVMIWMQPVTTTDLYGYVARGYLYAQQHINPMTNKALTLPGGLTVDRPAAPYGPLWLLITGLVSRLAGSSLLLNMLAFKVIALAAMGAALALVDRLACKLYPERRLRIYILFGWSPLLLFETIGNGHNDIVMVVCVLAAFALMLRGNARLAFALFVLGALIKYVSAVFVPLWLVYELRRRVRKPVTGVALQPALERPVTSKDRLSLRVWGQVALRTLNELDRGAAIGLLLSAALIGIGLTAACYVPFWDGLHTFTGLGQQLRPLYYNSSIIGFVTGPFVLIVPAAHQASVDKTVRLIFYAIFAIYAYLQTQRLWVLGPAATLREVITAAAKIMFAALILITFWYQPWYVVWLLPLAALSMEPFVRRQSTILAAGALLTYAVGNFVLVGEPGIGRDLFVQFFEILIAFAPLLLLRTAPQEQGWPGILRRYAGLIGAGFRRPIIVERVMLVLILIVAALLRLVRLGGLFDAAQPGSSQASILRQVSGDLKVYLSDPQGLNGPFVWLQGLLVQLFGPTPFAALLPSAVVGSLTVLMIYLVTTEIMRQRGQTRGRAVGLLAALLAATSHWHVSLSRSGTEVVLLPLLLCLAVYALLVALRIGTQTQQPAFMPAMQRPAAAGSSHRRSRHRRHKIARMQAVAQDPMIERRRLLLFALCGLCSGLASDLAPGLWLVPLVVIGVLLLWRWHEPQGAGITRRRLVTLSLSAVLAGIPTIWHFVSRGIGFPVGSDFLARTGTQFTTGPQPISLAFWGQVARNAGDVLHLLASQDYSAGYPSAGGAPIIPALLGPFFYLGLFITLVRWREFSSHALLLLVALPLFASIAVGAPTGVIEAASVLPAMCILPAVAIYEIGVWLGHLPIALDRANGVRVFITPEQIGRVLLFVFLLVSTIRTFYWYFEVTLPTSTPNQYIPS
jgi:dolichyl-phosphate-mannose-protein mannosyltransferase/glycosyl transferase family 87